MSKNFTDYVKTYWSPSKRLNHINDVLSDDNFDPLD